MTTTANMPELVLRSPDASWNRERWEQLPNDGNRYEVIDGVLYMTTAPSSFHQWIIRQVVRSLFRQIDEPGIGVTLWAPIGLFMPNCDPVQPDIVIIRTNDLDIMHDRRIYGIPALLIEVLSPTNADADLRIKRSAYARAQLPEYWIIRPASRDAPLCTQPDLTMDDYAQVQHVLPDAELVSPTLPFRAAVADFFTDAPDPTL